MSGETPLTVQCDRGERRTHVVKAIKSKSCLKPHHNNIIIETSNFRFGKFDRYGNDSVKLNVSKNSFVIISMNRRKVGNVSGT